MRYLRLARVVQGSRREVGAQSRHLSHFRVVDHVAPCQHVRQRPGGTDPGSGESLKLAVKQYIPLSNEKPGPGDVTIVGAHANAFPKEMYEPLWDDLYETMRARGRQIRGIWIADSYHQNSSGIFNERMLGNDPSWWDHARDLLFLINSHQNEMPQPIIGIGHSLGAAQLACLSLLHPRLLHALVLMEPVIQIENAAMAWTLASTYRRDIWPSRNEAAQKFRSSPFCLKWDPRVFDQWIKYGLRDLPTELYPDGNGSEAVTLTSTVAQEVFTMLRPGYDNSHVPHALTERQSETRADDMDDLPFYRPESAELFHRLPDLKPSIHYIFGESSEVSSPEARAKKMQLTGVGTGGSGGQAKGRVNQETLAAGHLVPLEDVTTCARIAASFVDAEVARFHQDQEDFIKYWQRKPRLERINVDDEWKKILGPPAKSRRS